MQIKFVCIIIPLPCAAFKKAGPVIGRQQLSALSSARPPVIVVPVGALSGAAAGLEPGVVIGAMVYNQVHKDLEPPLVGSFQHLFENIQVAKIRVDIHVIGYIIAVVSVGRRVQRRKPYSIHAETFDIVQLTYFCFFF